MQNITSNLRFFALSAAMLALPFVAAAAETEETANEAAELSNESAPSGNYQEESTKQDSWFKKIRATGAISTQFMFADKINREKPDDQWLNNTYFDLTINAPYVSIGGRFEWAKWPLPGYEKEFKGWGVPYIWATGKYKWAQLTVGDYYEQFGSGLILRTYQERSLGVDNALRGARLKLNPSPGVYFTALGGKQRYYWEHNSSWIWGADAEWNLDETFRKAFGYDYGLNLGVSYVGKHEKDEDIFTEDYEHRLNLPRNTGAVDVRAKVRLHDFNVLAEFATKNNDPNADNGYIYRRGNAVLLSATYATKGFSAYLQAKRSDNMSYRSKRSVTGISSFINHLPAFTMTQTYALAAMYPYSTQMDGEWAFQGEVRYQFKRGSSLGGKYGTNVRLTGSYISGLDRNIPKDSEGNVISQLKGSDGYGAPFWKIGSLYYADANLEIQKKLSKKFQFTLFYLFQKYNQQVIEQHGEAMITANTFIFEGQWKMAKKTQLRFELQYLQTNQDKKDWMCGLVELSLAPHWMFTFQDMYNIGKLDEEKNYFNAMVTYNYRANRFTFGYGKVRAGYNCSGGVCRWVPSYQGFTLTYNYAF